MHPFDQLVHVAGAVQQRIISVQVKMDELFGHAPATWNWDFVSSILPSCWGRGDTQISTDWGLCGRGPPTPAAFDFGPWSLYSLICVGTGAPCLLRPGPARLFSRRRDSRRLVRSDL